MGFKPIRRMFLLGAALLSIPAISLTATRGAKGTVNAGRRESPLQILAHPPGLAHAVFNQRFMPPPGTTCMVDWLGEDDQGRQLRIASGNCFESVNYFISGDPTSFAYRSWPKEMLADPELDASWRALEQSLRVGDVVEFELFVRVHGGPEVSNPFHAQLCAASGGRMVGANNEPAFPLINGIPTPTMRWAECTSQQYYQALKEVDAAWRKLGYMQRYQVHIYRNPAPAPPASVEAPLR